MRIALFYALLVAVVGLSWWRGRADERWAAAICVVGTLLTVWSSPGPAVRHEAFSPVETLIDVGVLLAFVVLALRSDRFWPMWVAGLQLTATSVHLMKFAAPDLLDIVVGVALAAWSYPILLAIAIGALRTDTVLRWREASELHPLR